MRKAEIELHSTYLKETLSSSSISASDYIFVASLVRVIK